MYYRHRVSVPVKGTGMGDPEGTAFLLPLGRVGDHLIRVKAVGHGTETTGGVRIADSKISPEFIGIGDHPIRISYDTILKPRIESIQIRSLPDRDKPVGDPRVTEIGDPGNTGRPSGEQRRHMRAGRGRGGMPATQDQAQFAVAGFRL